MTYSEPTGQNLVMDLHEVHTTLTYLIRDHDSTYTAAIDAVLSDSAIAIIKQQYRYHE